MKTHKLFPLRSLFAAVTIALLALTAVSSAQNDASLTNLTFSGGAFSPTFDSGTNDYTATVPYATSSVTVTPTTTDPNATNTVNGSYVAYGNSSDPISLGVGATNVITIVVVSADSSATLTYTLTVTRSPASTNADLTNLETTPTTTFSPTPFDSGTNTYTATVPYTTTNITVTPTAADATATITVNGNGVTSGSPSGSIDLGVGATNVITTVVTAEDSSTKTYTLTVTRAAPSSNADLSNLVPTPAMTFSPTFASNTLSYTATVLYATASMTVTPTSADGTGTITVNGNTVASGSPSGTINLSVGTNLITTVVTAQDSSTKTYTLTVTRALGSTWANSNVTGTPASSLNWSNAPLGAWTDVTPPVSTNTGTIQFFQDNTTALLNTVAATQTSVVDYGGLFQLGTLTLSGRASATASANLTNTISGDPLNFSATNGTINLNGVNNTRTLTYDLNSAIQLGTATNATALTITGSGSGTFRIGGNISELQTGGGSLLKSGSSSVTLSGANSYSGGTTVSAGTVGLNSATALGIGNVSVTGNSRFNTPASGNTYANPIAISSNQVLSLQIPNTATATSTFGGAVSGAGGITVVASGLNNNSDGTIALTNTGNTFTGPVTLPSSGNSADNFSFASIGDDPGAGAMAIGKVSYRAWFIYTGASNLTLANRQLALNSIFGGTVQGNGSPINAFKNNGSGTVTFNRDMSVGAIAAAGGTFWFGGSNTGTNTFAGIIPAQTSAGALGVGKTDAGKWILTRDNTFTGAVTIAQGTLSVNAISASANAQPLGKGSLVQLGYQVNTATLEFTGSANTTANRQFQIGSGGNVNVAHTGGGIILNNGNGSLTFTNGMFNAQATGINAARTLTLGGTYDGANGANAIQGTIQTNSPSAVALTVSGSVWALSGTSIYSGVTTVSGGTLVAGTNAPSAAAGAFGNASSEVVLGVASGNTSASILIGGAFNVGRIIRIPTANGTDAGTRVLTLGGNTAHNSIFSGNIILGTASQAGRGVTLTAASGGQVTFSGVIQNPTSMDATAYTVTKSGLGTVVFANANTYTGATTVTAGTLALTGSGSIANSPTISVGGGAVLDVSAVSFTLGASQTLKGNGTVTGAATINGTLSPGTSPGTLTFSNNLVLNASSTNTFEVDGSTPTNNVVVLGADVTYGGVLNIVPTGTFTNGQTFTLFSGAGATNVSNFASPIVGSPGAGLAFSFTNGVLAVVGTGPSGPELLTNSVSGGVLSLSWPAGQGWRLQCQTNALTVGLNTNWVEAAGSSVSITNITINTTQPTVFYRLIYP